MWKRVDSFTKDITKYSLWSAGSFSEVWNASQSQQLDPQGGSIGNDGTTRKHGLGESLDDWGFNSTNTVRLPFLFLFGVPARHEWAFLLCNALLPPIDTQQGSPTIRNQSLWGFTILCANWWPHVFAIGVMGRQLTTQSLCIQASYFPSRVESILHL